MKNKNFIIYQTAVRKYKASMKKFKVPIFFVFTHIFEQKIQKNYWTKNAENFSCFNFLKFLRIQKKS
jgi:hypothetical protein